MKKKKVLKLIKKHQEQQSSFSPSIFTYLVILVPIVIYFIYPDKIPQHGQYLPKLVLYQNVDTKSVPYSVQSAWYKPKTLSTLLERHLRSNTDLYVVCMHHLDLKRPYRACSFINREFNVVYFMLNPKIVEKSGVIKEYEEESQSCNEIIKSKRHSCVTLGWFDGKQEIGAELCGETAIVIQLNIDEFEGNGHCFKKIKN